MGVRGGGGGNAEKALPPPPSRTAKLVEYKSPESFWLVKNSSPVQISLRSPNLPPGAVLDVAVHIDVNAVRSSVPCAVCCHLRERNIPGLSRVVPTVKNNTDVPRLHLIASSCNCEVIQAPAPPSLRPPPPGPQKRRPSQEENFQPTWYFFTRNWPCLTASRSGVFEQILCTRIKKLLLILTVSTQHSYTVTENPTSHAESLNQGESLVAKPHKRSVHRHSFPCGCPLLTG